MARILLLCLLTAAACKAVDPAIRNYEFQQNWIKLVTGPDRGLKHYVDMVNDSVERSPHTRWGFRVEVLRRPASSTARIIRISGTGRNPKRLARAHAY